jgi:hypothetical protein
MFGGTGSAIDPAAHLEEIEANCARFGALGSNPMADRLLGVLGDQSLELTPGEYGRFGLRNISPRGQPFQRCERARLCNILAPLFHKFFYIANPRNVAIKAKPNQRLCAAQSSHQTPTNLPKSVTWNRRHMMRECNSLEYFLMMVATVFALILQLPDTPLKILLALISIDSFCRQ